MKFSIERLEQRQLAACAQYAIFIEDPPPTMIQPPPPQSFTVIEAAIGGRDPDSLTPDQCVVDEGLTWFWGDGYFFHIQAGRRLSDPTYVNRYFPYLVPGDYTIELYKGVYLEKPTDREPVATMELSIAEWHTVGDVNADGVFSTGDLVKMFQSGKYETGESANFFEGDMNYDGVVDSTDLVFAMANGEWMS